MPGPIGVCCLAAMLAPILASGPGVDDDAKSVEQGFEPGFESGLESGAPVDLGGGRELTLGPDDPFYPVYRADPRRARTGLALGDVRTSDVEGVGGRRFWLWMGERFPLARLHPAGRPDEGVQLDLDVGFSGQFDQERSNDNLGWDGTYSFQLSGPLTERRAWRFGINHVSSHVGDEFIDTTGRERLGYTREEVFLGLAQGFGEGGHAYLDYGHAYDFDAGAGMERGRAQAGIQLEPPRAAWGGRLGPYYALDVSAFEENDWEPNLTLEVGWTLALGERGRAMSLGLLWYDGRVPIGEFFEEDESYLSLVLGFDL